LKIELPGQRFSVMDVTLRDGGLANGFAWAEDLATTVCQQLARSGVEWIEPGYVGGVSSGSGWYEGACSDLQPEFISSLGSVAGGSGLSAVFNPSRRSYEPEWHTLAQAGLKMVRIPTDSGKWKQHHAIVERIKKKAPSLLVSFNVTNIASYDLRDLRKFFDDLAGASIDAVFATDTTSQLLPARMSEIALLMSETLPSHLVFGYHGHDSLGCATANLIEGVRHGIALVDSSLLGYGRGGGNLKTELIQVWRLLSREAATAEAILAVYHAVRAVAGQIGRRSDGVVLAIVYAVLGLPQEQLEAPLLDEVVALRGALALGGIAG
jgi:4-hydroxy 2-oxovalerate aldolase